VEVVEVVLLRVILLPPVETLIWAVEEVVEQNQ
jgi:hypothetical protein